MTDDLTEYFGELPADIPNLPVFDIRSVNLVQLGRQLQQNLDERRSRWIFLKRRGNERAVLDEEHMRALIAQIQDLRDMNSILLELNADVYLTQERLARIIQRYREHENFVDAEGRRLAVRAEEQHKSELQILKDEALRRERELEALKLENERREIEIAILKAQRENIVGQGTKEQIKMDFMKKVIDTIDLNELPDYLRTFVINSIFNPSQQITGELQLMEDLKEFAIRREKAQAEKEEAQAESEQAQATIATATADKTVMDFDRLKKQKEGK